MRIGPNLNEQAAADGAGLHTEINNNIFQDDSGAWQMVVTYYVANSRFPKAGAWTRPRPPNPILANWITVAAGT